MIADVKDLVLFRLRELIEKTEKSESSEELYTLLDKVNCWSDMGSKGCFHVDESKLNKGNSDGI